MIEWAVIGVIVGLLLGLTGSGGAVISIPLFVYLLGTSFHDATVYSLYAVAISSALGWFVQRRYTDTPTSLFLAGFSFLGAIMFANVKRVASPDLIKLLFIVVCVASLISIWRPYRGNSLSAPKAPRIKAAFGGIVLGALVTMTGLGGGVILVPLLVGPLQIPFQTATATSLFTIFLTSLVSISVQYFADSPGLSPLPLLALLGGSVTASIAVKTLLQGVPPIALIRMRQYLISAVILTSVISILRTFGHSE